MVLFDLARIERAVGFVEAWWTTLATPAEEAVRLADGQAITSALGALGRSKFFVVTRDEGALLRFALESRVVGEVFPEAAESVAPFRARIDAIEESSSRTLAALRRGRADVAWNELLGPAAS